MNLVNNMDEAKRQQKLAKSNDRISRLDAENNSQEKCCCVLF